MIFLRQKTLILTAGQELYPVIRLLLVTEQRAGNLETESSSIRELILLTHYPGASWLLSLLLAPEAKQNVLQYLR